MQELRLQALLSIHSHCSECPPNVVVFEAEGFVEVIAQELMLTRDADPVLPNDFCMELVAITWTVIATSPTGLRRFLQAEGAPPRSSHSRSTSISFVQERPGFHLRGMTDEPQESAC